MSEPLHRQSAKITTFDLVGPGQFAAAERVLPPIPEGWARIRFLYCGVCGSDLSHFEGRRPTSYPHSMGHEFVARVEEIGEDVSGLARGDIVTSDLNFRCGHCQQCKLGRTHLCEAGQQGLFTNRGFADGANIHASYLRLIPGASAEFQFALAEPLSCVLHGIDWLNLDERCKTLVVGGGSLGLCAAFALDVDPARGRFDIIEISGPRRERIAKAMLRGRAIASTTQRYETVLDVSGTPSGLEAAVSSVASGGRLCSLSHLDGLGGGSFLAERLQRRDITFKLSYLNGPTSTLTRAIATIAEHWSEGWSGCVAISPLNEVQQVFEARASSRANKDMVQMPAQNLGT